MPPELFPRPTFSLNPEAGRTGPKLWVKRIVIWREPNVVLRDIPLRPGLNVVWSPDSLTEDSPIGHGGGKQRFAASFVSVWEKAECFREEAFLAWLRRWSMYLA